MSTRYMPPGKMGVLEVRSLEDIKRVHVRTPKPSQVCYAISSVVGIAVVVSLVALVGWFMFDWVPFHKSLTDSRHPVMKQVFTPDWAIAWEVIWGVLIGGGGMALLGLWLEDSGH